jgi:hypothetical protein
MEEFLYAKLSKNRYLRGLTLIEKHSFFKEILFIYMIFFEPACDGQHGYRVPSVNSAFIGFLIC